MLLFFKGKIIDEYQFIEDFGRYLKFHGDKNSWKNASKTWEKEEGKLVVIDSDKKQLAIEKGFKNIGNGKWYNYIGIKVMHELLSSSYHL